ncbi:hypothetical protein BSLG_002341 [Batrachochytrium salamandrivorans]|nr:hypothetical protein BASA83_000056 [Batrachochytrium salamandrivorans]KAJ1343315.1 hypothetical protein BSLG_002341 [Batrachochytrium salamandrivorans]
METCPASGYGLDQRVTPDATVQEYREKMNPKTIFIVPTVADVLVDIPLHQSMQQMQFARKTLDQTQLKRMLREEAVRTKGRHYMDRAAAYEGSPHALDSAISSTRHFNIQEYNNMHHEDDENSRFSPLHIAARDNSVKGIKLWIQSFSKNTLNSHDFTPLMVASSHNSLRALKFLLKAGVRKNDVDSVTQRTALHWAVIHGHSQAARTLIRFGADARFRDRDGRTPVHLACISPCPKCLGVMLKLVNPAVFLEGDDEQMTPIHLAAMNDNVRHLSMIISQHAPIDLTSGDVEGKTALHWCAQNNVPRTYSRTILHKPTTCMRLLIENNRNLVGISDLEGRTPLHLACTSFNMPLIFAIFNQLIGTHKLKLIINTQDVVGRTAMHYSAIGGHAYILRVLRHYGAEDGLIDKNGATPLHYACSKNHGQCVSVLIGDNRLYENYIRDHRQRTPIMWAALKGNAETLRILLEAGVNPNDEDDKKITGGHAHCASLLLEHGAGVDVQNSDQRSALFLAAQYSHGETVNILIQHGANVNLLDRDRRSPLHWAALCGHLSVISLLISCRATIDMVDSEGKTPLHCAAYNGHTKVLGFLAKNGAVPDHKDNEGVSALHWATCGNYLDCVHMLLQLRVSPNIMDNDHLTPLDYALSVRSYECAKVLQEYGGQTGEIISHIYAIRIQKAWRRTLKSRQKAKSIVSSIRPEYRRLGTRFGSNPHLFPSNRMSSIMSLYKCSEKISLGSMELVSPRRKSLPTGIRIYRGVRTASVDQSGETAEKGVVDKGYKPKAVFPSRPTLIKEVISKSRGQLCPQPTGQDTTAVKSNAATGKTVVPMTAFLSTLSMSSLEMDYFIMAEAQHKLDE